MKVGQEIVSCAYVDTGDRAITQALVDDNQENTGYLAVTIAVEDSFHAADSDNVTTTPVPKVQLMDRLDPANVSPGTPPATANDSYLRVYGALATINTASGRCGVITKGIVPFKKGAASAPGDIGTGLIPPVPTNHNWTTGTVNAGTGGDGTGTVIGRSGNILWVDLDAEQAKV